MAMVPYNYNAYFRMYEREIRELSDDETASVDSTASLKISDRLEKLLETAREANKEEHVPLEDFLAGLQLEQKATSLAYDIEEKASITVAHHINHTLEETHKSEPELQNEANKDVYVSHHPATVLEATVSVPRATQTDIEFVKIEQLLAKAANEVPLVPRATQTDSESQHIQELLAKATRDAYERGFFAGKREGFKEAQELSMPTTRLQADAATCAQQTAEEDKVKILGKAAPKIGVSENTKPGNDPFQSLLGLFRRM